MREIKFRYTVKRESGYVFSRIFTISEIEIGEVIVWANANVVDLDRVNREQFTGLLDKNGREIYEGDAVKWYINSRAYLGLVEYVDRFGGFDMRNPGRDGYVCNDWLRGEYEVIGTIHENPELLS